VFWSR